MKNKIVLFFFILAVNYLHADWKIYNDTKYIINVRDPNYVDPNTGKTTQVTIMQDTWGELPQGGNVLDVSSDGFSERLPSSSSVVTIREMMGAQLKLQENGMICCKQEDPNYGCNECDRRCDCADGSLPITPPEDVYDNFDSVDVAQD